MSKVETVEALRTIYKPAVGRAVDKQLGYLDPHCKSFIALSPFLVIGTQGKDGPGDTSPRGDMPGFVGVEGDRTLLIPDRPGNNRLDNYLNILSNPEVGLIFLIPGVNETLRVNGTAEIHDDAALCQQFAVDGKPALTVLKVTVREAYLHCPKALMRSKLWQSETAVERSVLPSLGQMINDQTNSDAAAETQAEMEARYKDVLY